MSAKIILTVTCGSLKGKTFVFPGPARCTIGRAGDCELSLLHELGNGDVSRHHCVLEIDPPRARVRDLGSLNGTYVNGQKIGQRPPFLPPEAARQEGLEACWLGPGDRIQVGGVVFSFEVVNTSDSLEKTAALSGLA
jgi:pSer/pThr/pTyr-binding forkhead associated (FHA) protein